MTRTARREFTKAQRVQMVKRASDASGNIFCEGCGLNVTGKAIEFDHVIAESHRHPDDLLKPLTIEDGQLLGRDCCHRAPGGKTSSDTTIAAKLKRIEARHKGARAPRKPIQSRGFPKAAKKQSATAPLTKWAAWRQE